MPERVVTQEKCHFVGFIASGQGFKHKMEFLCVYVLERLLCA